MDNAQRTWPHKTPVAIDPSKRKGLLIFAVVVAFLLVFSLKGNDIAQFFANNHDRDMLEPQMPQLVAQGKPEAVLWMMKHNQSFYEKELASNFPALRAAAETGHPESMYAYARVLQYLHDDAGANVFMARAKDAGFPAALLSK